MKRSLSYFKVIQKCKGLSGFPPFTQGTFEVASTLLTTFAFLELTTSYVVCQFLNLWACWSRVQYLIILQDMSTQYEVNTKCMYILHTEYFQVLKL